MQILTKLACEQGEQGEIKMLKFNGKWFVPPWSDWDGVEISPEGIRTHQGTIKISAIRLAIWRLQHGRSYAMMQDGQGQAVRLMLD